MTFADTSRDDTRSAAAWFLPACNRIAVATAVSAWTGILMIRPFFMGVACKFSLECDPKPLVANINVVWLQTGFVKIHDIAEGGPVFSHVAYA